MLKIIHIIPNLNCGGAEKLVQDICTYIHNNKLAKICLLTFKNNQKSDLSFHINIPSYYCPSLTSKPKLKINDLQRFINKFNPDIIHTHLWESELLLKKIEIGNTQRFSHFHDNMIQLSKKIPKNKIDITNRYERNIFLKKNSNKFITISKDTFKYAKKVIPKDLQNNIYFLPNAINYNNFYRENKQTFNSIRLINIGTFVNKKNQILALEIVKIILQKGFNVELTFLGDGPEKNKLLEYSIKLGIQNRIHFAGIVKNVNEYLWNSNMYLHTATYEPFGLVLIEAMAARLPVISLDGRGNRDFINHEENGYIFKRPDPNIFADTIIKLFEDKKLYEKISNNGQKTAETYDIKNYAMKLLDTYKTNL